MKVVVHIDRMVLRGIAPGQRDALVDALRKALTAEVVAPGAAERVAASGHRESLRAQVVGSHDAASLGHAAGQRIGRELKP
ncbi:conserved hypothetical protein [Burkholderiales bacterium 8X]|nr:conserved hypothetical protein [Burkholderiales bacterium 8X]